MKRVSLTYSKQAEINKICHYLTIQNNPCSILIKQQFSEILNHSCVDITFNYQIAYVILFRIIYCFHIDWVKLKYIL